jgi:hypothetical protein
VARFRHQQPASEVADDADGTAEGDEAAGDGERPEKIEVHVHVHRDDAKKARAKRRPEKSPLTGVLFDWHAHYDQIFKKPPPWAGSSGPKVGTCEQCKAPVGRMARSCNRCGAQRPSTHVISKVAAMLGLGVVALVFGLCAHYLGHSTASYVAPKPVGEWSESDVVFVGVPAEPSAFSYSDSTTAGSATDRMATR